MGVEGQIDIYRKGIGSGEEAVLTKAWWLLVTQFVVNGKSEPGLGADRP